MTIVSHNAVTSSSDCSQTPKDSKERFWEGARLLMHFISHTEYHAHFLAEGEILTTIEDFDQHITNAVYINPSILERLMNAIRKRPEMQK
jgi:Fe-S oxidoreductase